MRRLRAALALHVVAIALCCGRIAARADTWAVVVSSSRFWLNYRHTSNALGVYQAIKRLGVPDSRIVLMLADCSGCDPRNPAPGEVVSTAGGASLQTADTEVDYRGRDVSVASLLRVLVGRHPPGTPPSRRLDSGPTSRVLLYLTGHGGDGFLKFHDQEELLAADVAGAVAQMAAAGRYGTLLLVADTCQAATLYEGIAAPRWAGVASSLLGQSSYAAHSDPEVGAHLVDEFSLHLMNYLRSLPGPHTNATLADMVRHVRAQSPLSSTIDVAGSLGRRLSEVRVAEFFGSGGGGDAEGQPAPAPAWGWPQRVALTLKTLNPVVAAACGADPKNPKSWGWPQRVAPAVGHVGAEREGVALDTCGSGGGGGGGGGDEQRFDSAGSGEEGAHPAGVANLAEMLLNASPKT